MKPVTYSWLAVVLAVACAAIGWLGIAGWVAAVVALASVGAHVAGNALGTRMRESTDRDLARLPRRSVPLVDLPRSPPAHLQRHQSLGRLVPVAASIGACVGGVSGATALTTLTSATAAGAVLGGISAAVIGGLFGFLMASFVEIIRTSLREAVAAERSSVTAKH